MDNIVEYLADNLVHIAPLPDVTPLQKQINRLYLKLRMCGMPADEVSEAINALLKKHGISKKQLLKVK